MIRRIATVIAALTLAAVVAWRHERRAMAGLRAAAVLATHYRESGL